MGPRRRPHAIKGAKSRSEPSAAPAVKFHVRAHLRVSTAYICTEFALSVENGDPTLLQCGQIYFVQIQDGGVVHIGNVKIAVPEAVDCPITVNFGVRVQWLRSTVGRTPVFGW